MTRVEELAELIRERLGEGEAVIVNDRCAGADEQAATSGEFAKAVEAVDELVKMLGTAHGGLLRALDYRAATPNGLAVKDDVWEALRESGFEGGMGEVLPPFEFEVEPPFEFEL